MPQFSNTQAVMRRCFVALGSNTSEGLERSAEILRGAVGALAGFATQPIVVSRFYHSEAFPPGSGPDFVNAALAFDSDLPPVRILRQLHRIERDFGRIRRERWGQRALDLDLLAIGDLVLPDAQTLRHWIELSPDQQRKSAPDQLILPHPRLQDRAFVILPLLEIAADWHHPLSGQTLREMADALPSGLAKSVIPLANSFSTP